MGTNRRDDLIRFYQILSALETKVGGKKLLGTCNGRMDWPRRGVYFFFEPGEMRSHSGGEPRVVRVGTHAVAVNSRSTLYRRLSQHRGVHKTGGGNHRGSIFRLLIGESILARERMSPIKSWGTRQDPGKAAAALNLTRAQVLQSEHALELLVSSVIRQMPFLWIAVDDDPGRDSARGLIERNSIALLSNYRKPSLDPSSPSWLGQYCERERVRQSGLWNNNHVDETYGATFLATLERYATRTAPVL